MSAGSSVLSAACWSVNRLHHGIRHGETCCSRRAGHDRPVPESSIDRISSEGSGVNAARTARPFLLTPVSGGGVWPTMTSRHAPRAVGGTAWTATLVALACPGAPDRGALQRPCFEHRPLAPRVSEEMLGTSFWKSTGASHAPRRTAGRGNSTTGVPRWVLFVLVDARYLKARDGRMVASKAALVVSGIDAEGRRAASGVCVGGSDSEASRCFQTRRRDTTQVVRLPRWKLRFRARPAGRLLR